MGFVEAGDIRLWHESAGRGPRLLYISGTGADLRRTPNPLLCPLAQSFELLTFDQRGLGRSDKPAGPYSMQDYAEDAAHLLDALGWDRCHVMGVSFGGMVAQELAIRFPSRVNKLVLCCCATGGAGGASYPLHEIDRLPLAEKIDLRLMRTDTRIDAAWIAAHSAEYQAMVEKAMAESNLFADEPGRAEGARWQLQARAEHDTWDRVGKIVSPTLVCGGHYDGQAEPAVIATLAKRIPGAALAMFEGGHGFLGQDPAAYERIAEFLAA